MKNLLFCLLMAIPAVSATGTQKYANGKYTVEVSDAGAMKVLRNGSKASAEFTPDFRMGCFDTRQKYSMQRIEKQGFSDNLNYRTFTWGSETDLFRAVDTRKLVVDRIELLPDRADITFKPTPDGRLSASLTMPADGEPMLSFEFKADKEGYYTIGYCGSPVSDPGKCDELWQPLVWTQKRFPGKSYLTPDFLCSMPLTAVRAGGRCYGVVVDPECFPFQPLPTYRTFRFGVALRNTDGLAQPMVWAPIAGTTESRLGEGETFSFAIRLFADAGSMSDLHEDLAMNLYGLKDYKRDNSIGVNLNATIDNMVGYGMSQYSWFIEEMKGCSYETDVKNAVKNSTALNPLNIAVVMDNEDIYNRRFLPMCEFMLSRANLLFSLAPKEGVDGQVPSNTLGKPVINLTEAAAIYAATGKQSGFLLNRIVPEKEFRSPKAHEKFWRDNLSLYDATGNRDYLDKAREGADLYIREVIGPASDKFDYKYQNSSSFWTSLSPRFPELYNMYEATGDKSYLEAARYAARRYAQFIWMCPAIPQRQVTVNEGGQAPKQKPWGEPVKVPEESVDGWRLSEIGLHAECGSTANSHRAVFPAHHAAYMLKIASATGDRFLRKIANWAVVGRYANFPGYHINTARTTVYEKPDFPLRHHNDMNVNSMHYNHIWPQMSILMDYLMTDFMDKSDGAIAFPSLTIEAFANLGSQMYGHRPGKFYGRNVILWMPSGLVKTSNPQLNYLSAREGRDKLFVAFANQSSSPQKAAITFDPSLAGITDGTKVTVWRNNKSAGSGTVRNGSIEIEVAGDGITAIAIEKAALDVKFQDRFFSPSPKWKTDYAKSEYGRAMLLNFGRIQPVIYSYVTASNEMYKRAAISYRFDEGKWCDLLDCNFPYEFSIPVPEGANKFEFRFTIVDSDNKTIREETQVLSK